MRREAVPVSDLREPAARTAGFSVTPASFGMLGAVPYIVKGASMEPSLYAGNRVLSERIDPNTHPLCVDDVVTLKDPFDAKRTLIKRCSAVAGEIIYREEGVLFVRRNGGDEPVRLGSLVAPDPSSLPTFVEYPYRVPQGFIWVMGDNEGRSLDSRRFGAVPVASVTGVVRFVFWPPASMGTLSVKALSCFGEERRA